MTISLQKSILYGPVRSRRLGKSLGINLMPVDYKLCSFNCIYCQYGWTRKWTMDGTRLKQDLPSGEAVIEAVDKALQSDVSFAYLTFSGNGEPTLHPEFPEIVRAVNRSVNTYRPNVKLALLSNSTGLMNERVIDVIPLIDLPVMKLDAGTEETFKAINHPAAGAEFTELIKSLEQLSQFYIQTAFLDGNPSNIEDEELIAYFDIIKKITPVEVHIYSIERSYPHAGIYVIPGERLEEIAEEGCRRTGIPFRAFYRKQS